jgi:hypothetical protein
LAVRRFDAAAFTESERPVLVGHRQGEAEAIAWRVKSGRLSRASRAPWAAIGAASFGAGVLVVGREGQTLHVDDLGAHLSGPHDRKTNLRGVTRLASGVVVAFGTGGQVLRRGRAQWEPWSIAPPLPRIGGKLRGAAPANPPLAGVAGDPDKTVFAFATDGSSWSRTGGPWAPFELPLLRQWTCAATRPSGLPIVAGPGLALLGAGARWRSIPLGELVPIAVAAWQDELYVADGASVWRIDGKTPRLVLSEPVTSLAAAEKGLLAVTARSVLASSDGAHWATLA